MAWESGHTELQPHLRSTIDPSGRATPDMNESLINCVTGVKWYQETNGGQIEDQCMVCTEWTPPINDLSQIGVVFSSGRCHLANGFAARGEAEEGGMVLPPLTGWMTMVGPVARGRTSDLSTIQIYILGIPRHTFTSTPDEATVSGGLLLVHSMHHMRMNSWKTLESIMWIQPLLMCPTNKWMHCWCDIFVGFDYGPDVPEMSSCAM